jgi:hypothetical protein
MHVEARTAAVLNFHGEVIHNLGAKLLDGLGRADQKQAGRF